MMSRGQLFCEWNPVPSAEDPIESLEGLSFNHPIPELVRQFGKALDPQMLEPGDLILVSSRSPNFFGRKTEAHQSRLFAAEHAKWHHAAVSGGRFEICESTTSGVKACEYWAYMTGRYDIRVRRLKGANEAIRSKLAFFAATYVGTSYGFLNALNLRAILGGGDPWKKPFFRTGGVICSQLYFEACMRVGYLLAPLPPETICPAHLSQTSLLEDIPLSWVKV